MCLDYISKDYLSLGTFQINKLNRKLDHYKFHMNNDIFNNWNLHAINNIRQYKDNLSLKYIYNRLNYMMYKQKKMNKWHNFDHKHNKVRKFDYHNIQPYIHTKLLKDLIVYSLNYYHIVYIYYIMSKVNMNNDNLNSLNL